MVVSFQNEGRAERLSDMENHGYRYNATAVVKDVVVKTIIKIFEMVRPVQVPQVMLNGGDLIKYKPDVYRSVNGYIGALYIEGNVKIMVEADNW